MRVCGPWLSGTHLQVDEVLLNTFRMSPKTMMVFFIPNLHGIWVYTNTW
jgi:hypothetical protein